MSCKLTVDSRSFEALKTWPMRKARRARARLLNVLYLPMPFLAIFLHPTATVSIAS
ncbi:hypothetical protein FOPG_05448 [Fusarium oxysporum f. sp. conglutinans race 2 54008]|uniref:Uncharacterized protein n=1 Tax=Fusarium oxysporum f. sp. conglutinans race 2 54008 TaxID=1089457 RepID=X0IC22_FUSOX|nr:hypothetical protein FOPG_05448 [Fusarium oxysporum f. sp. conglutinans race 2 54008]